MTQFTITNPTFLLIIYFLSLSELGRDFRLYHVNDERRLVETSFMSEWNGQRTCSFHHQGQTSYPEASFPLTSGRKRATPESSGMNSHWYECYTC